MPTTHRLEPDLTTLHGFFSRERAPVLTIDPGDTVVYRTLESGWRVEPLAGGAYRPVAQFPGYDPTEHGDGHALVGPVAVRGALPGMTLAVHVEAIVPGTWGQCLTGGWPSFLNNRYGIQNRGVVHAWTMDPTTMTGRNHLGHTIALRPFMGVMGMPPDAPGRHSTIPPRVWGGNLDCKDLVAGSTLYLPIPVEGALFSVGDGHGVQGDGELGGTALECPMERVALRFELRDDFPIAGPVAQTPVGWLTMGLGDTLEEATFAALEAMFALMGRLYGLARLDAIALASVVVDLRITQIANDTFGVHALLAKDVPLGD